MTWFRSLIQGARDWLKWRRKLKSIRDKDPFLYK